MKAKEKRNPHSYKVTDAVYKKANKRAKKDNTTLAEQIEHCVKSYANGDIDCYFYYLLPKLKSPNPLK